MLFQVILAGFGLVLTGRREVKEL